MTTEAPTTPTTRSKTATHTPRARRQPNGWWLVESRTERGVGHQVNPVSGQCSCRAGKYGRACWHVALVRRILAWGEQTRGASAPVPPAPAPVPPAPAVQGDWHASAAYRGLAAAFGE